MKTSDTKPPKGRTKLARHFRKNMNESEAILWAHLRNRGLGVKFRRQVPVGDYVVDFLCMEVKLIVEADGSQHGNYTNLKTDYKRDQYLKGEGYSILRFWNRDIIKYTDETLKVTFDKIKELQFNISPSP